MPEVQGQWVCPTCGLGAEKHNLSLAILHIYGDVPKKDGTPLTREDTDEMMAKILGKEEGV